MDNDFDYSATAVWAGAKSLDPLPQPKPTVPTPSISTFEGAPLDDFDDFAPAQMDQSGKGDDDFDDFGDFGDVNDTSGGGFGFAEPMAGPSHARLDWYTLRVHPLAPRSELTNELDEILEPLWENDDFAQVTTDNQIREVEGISQILTTAESRDVYNHLVQTPPQIKPPNWIRSRIRRQHLIALGIPVNLDEVLPQANGKQLPPLQITTRPMSAPPGPRIQPHSNPSSLSVAASRANTPPNGEAIVARFGPKPELNHATIKTLLELDPDVLALHPIPILEKHLADLRAQIAQASTLLTHLLQSREALQQDSETYNRLIAELVGEAQKIKSGKSRTPVRRGTGY